MYTSSVGEQGSHLCFCSHGLLVLASTLVLFICKKSWDQAFEARAYNIKDSSQPHLLPDFNSPIAKLIEICQLILFS